MVILIQCSNVCALICLSVSALGWDTIYLMTLIHIHKRYYNEYFKVKKLVHMLISLRNGITLSSKCIWYTNACTSQCKGLSSALGVKVYGSCVCISEGSIISIRPNDYINCVSISWPLQVTQKMSQILISLKSVGALPLTPMVRDLAKLVKVANFQWVQQKMQMKGRVSLTLV